MDKDFKNQGSKEMVVVPKGALVLNSLVNPEKVIEFARRCAVALTDIINTKTKKVMVNGEQYLEFEDWQTVARFYNYTAGIESTNRLGDKEKFVGYEAKAYVKNSEGITISSAEASCLAGESRNWTFPAKPEFQFKSMAQTRAMAKALRNVLSWVVVLAGYKPTPAEEMDSTLEAKKTGSPGEPFPSKNPARKTAPDKTPEKKKQICGDCQGDITDAEVSYSQRKYGMVLCKTCQKKYKPKS